MWQWSFIAWLQRSARTTGDTSMITEQRKKVLIVDDDSITASLLQLFVSNAGYDLELATNGQEALDRIGKSQPDLVLLDLVMPEIS